MFLRRQYHHQNRNLILLSIKNRSRRIARALLVSTTIMTTLTPIYELPANASISSDENNTYTPPSGTLLLPLTPKLDAAKSQSQASVPGATATSTKDKTQTSSVVETAAEKGAVSALSANDGTEVINENATLKGTIQIVADDTEFDQEKNTFRYWKCSSDNWRSEFKTAGRQHSL